MSMFRKIPSKEFCEGLLKEMNIHGFTDTNLFMLSDIKVNDDWICLLDDYYIPCKLNKLMPITQAKAKTIIKHLLKLYSYKLNVIEKRNNGKTMTYYTIKPPTTKPKELDFLITFDL